MAGRGTRGRGGNGKLNSEGSGDSGDEYNELLAGLFGAVKFRWEVEGRVRIRNEDCSRLLVEEVLRRDFSVPFGLNTSDCSTDVRIEEGGESPPGNEKSLNISDGYVIEVEADATRERRCITKSSFPSSKLASRRSISAGDMICCGTYSELPGGTGSSWRDSRKEGGLEDLEFDKMGTGEDSASMGRLNTDRTSCSR